MIQRHQLFFSSIILSKKDNAFFFYSEPGLYCYLAFILGTFNIILFINIQIKQFNSCLLKINNIVKSTIKKIIFADRKEYR